MMYQIKHRHSGAVLFEAETESLRDCVVMAVREDANLAYADLTDSYLTDSYLADANLAGAIGVSVDAGPTEPYVRLPAPERYARRAAKFRERNPDVPVIPDIDRRILSAIEGGAGTLDMSSWHTCETTHCRAGWAVALAGEAGRALEEQHGPHMAGWMLYTAATGRVPHFFATNEAALADIREQAAAQEAA